METFDFSFVTIMFLIFIFIFIFIVVVGLRFFLSPTSDRKPWTKLQREVVRNRRKIVHEFMNENHGERPTIDQLAEIYYVKHKKEYEQNNDPIQWCRMSCSEAKSESET